MTEIILRLALFTALPVLLGATIVIFDKSAVGPVRRSEAFLVPLLLVGLGGSGVSEFISHVFIAEPAAPSPARESDSRFEVEVGFAYLAIGVLGAVAAQRRDGFREATVLVSAIFGIGVTVGLSMSTLATGNPTAASALPLVAALVTPALLVWFLLASRRAEQAEPPTIVLKSWAIPVRRGSAFAVAAAAMALPIGYATGQGVVATLAAMAVAAAAFWLIVNRAPSHRLGARG